uniref:Uncharacterized protein n=1 Tax=Setaria digitata TaxID=48799 RepID=A0A915PS07_9BILA
MSTSKVSSVRRKFADLIIQKYKRVDDRISTIPRDAGSEDRCNCSNWVQCDCGRCMLDSDSFPVRCSQRHARRDSG